MAVLSRSGRPAFVDHDLAAHLVVADAVLVHVHHERLAGGGDRGVTGVQAAQHAGAVEFAVAGRVGQHGEDLLGERFQMRLTCSWRVSSTGVSLLGPQPVPKPKRKSIRATWRPGSNSPKRWRHRGLLRHICPRRSTWPGAQKNQYRRLFSTCTPTPKAIITAAVCAPPRSSHVYTA